MYRIIVAIISFFTRLIRGIEVIGLENIPREGGAVVAANHTTWFDPFAVAVVIKRPVHFMGKAELFKYPGIRWILKQAYVFPVKRGLADRNAIRTAQERVSSGHLLGIFPEGTRNKSEDQLLPLQGGAALVALKTGVPVIPVIVTGSKPFQFRKVIKVIIGKPIDLGGPKKANKTAVSQGSSMISKQFSVLIRRNN